MLNINKNISTKRIQNGIYLFIAVICFIAMTLFICLIDYFFKLDISRYTTPYLISIICSISLVQILIWCVRNKVHKGIKYAFMHYNMVLNLRRAFLDSHYFNTRYYFNKKIALLPKIKIDFSNDFFTGKLYIENIHMNKDIRTSDLSVALNKYVVERSYLSHDENYYVFNIFNSKINRQLIFRSLDELREYVIKVEERYLVIDKFTKIPIHSSLFVGQTGSGKTYALYSLILQMQLKKDKYSLYFVDPKNSSLSVLGERISAQNTASNFDDIVDLLKKFIDLMTLSKIELKEKLNSKLEATYIDFGYPSHIFIFDEFASFQSQLQSKEKKKRDEVMSLISQVVLEGRQIGFFIWFVMQKSDSNLIPTYIRENLPVKFVIGNAEKQTYITAFGPGIDIKEKDFQLGEGLFICPLIANQPKLCHFSYLDFDILKAIEYFNE
ncbi:FtsK/SpoIIIE domain-containing protein [Facklamia sp. P12932]|uniref:FtsK/SpoIIIE domain-containing protein n=1 Tax=Facklamia sp. P12932 TaxID=3421947 RepID=UPI003D172ABD